MFTPFQPPRIPQSWLVCIFNKNINNLLPFFNPIFGFLIGKYEIRKKLNNIDPRRSYLAKMSVFGIFIRGFPFRKYRIFKAPFHQRFRTIFQAHSAVADSFLGKR